jgi:hypothetical protein
MDRESDGKVGGQLLEQLVSAFEDLETQSAGILQFLKAKGLATDEELAPYLQQAGDASNVRWRAARLRMDALLAAAIADAEEEFARKMEERARAHDESTAQKQEGRGEVQGKPANNEGVEAQKADARKRNGAKQNIPTSVSSAEDATKGAKEAAEAKKEEVETSSEVPAEKAGPESKSKRSDGAENNTNRDAA